MSITAINGKRRGRALEIVFSIDVLTEDHQSLIKMADKYNDNENLAAALKNAAELMDQSLKSYMQELNCIKDENTTFPEQKYFSSTLLDRQI